MVAVDRIDDLEQLDEGGTGSPESDVLPDAHEARAPRRFDRAQFARKAWLATWPKVAAIAVFLLLWQIPVWLDYKPFVIKGPSEVLGDLWVLLKDGVIADAAWNTLKRVAVGFAVSIVLGVAVGAMVSSSKIVRSAIGSMISGVQTMPSIAWFPLAIAIFGRTEGAIRFVIVLGAAPAIANGLITGVDQVPPLLLRAGRMLGAGGVKSYRHVILPATLPSFVGGLKQGWAFAWRSLLAGELLVIIARKPSVGNLLSQYRELSKYSEMMAMMIVIFTIGLVVDALFFSTVDRAIRRRWGLLTD